MVCRFSETFFACGIQFFKKLLLTSWKIVFFSRQQTMKNAGASPASVALMLTIVMNLKLGIVILKCRIVCEMGVIAPT